MKKILIINYAQFGYHTDTYQYCSYLRDKYSVVYLCWDWGYNKIMMEGISVVYVAREGSKVQRFVRFCKVFIQTVKQSSADTIFVVYFRKCSMLRILQPHQQFILDIRTGYVESNGIGRYINNFLMLLESIAFRRVTVISENLRKTLRLSSEKSRILPVGGIAFTNKAKKYDQINLLYVGTFHNRKIEATIEGFTRFIDQSKSRDFTYEIVGTGSKEEVISIQNRIKSSSHSDKILLHDWVPHSQLTQFFERNNIGVVFIPIERRYDPQPPTKLFEYLLSGMPVIATLTDENKRFVNDCNGILIDDTSEGFCSGLYQIYGKRSLYHAPDIRASSESFTWEKIVSEYLVPIIENSFSPHN